MFDQRPQRITRIKETPARVHIGPRQQHLPDRDTINIEELLPRLDEAALPDRRQHLLDRNGCRRVVMTKPLASGGHRTRRTAEHRAPALHELHALELGRTW